jgi:hypothetical protein
MMCGLGSWLIAFNELLRFRSNGYDVVTRLKQSSYLTCRTAYQGEYLPALGVGANSVSIVIAVFFLVCLPVYPIASFGYNDPSTWLGGEVR